MTPIPLPQIKQTPVMASAAKLYRTLEESPIPIFVVAGTEVVLISPEFFAVAADAIERQMITDG